MANAGKHDRDDEVSAEAKIARALGLFLIKDLDDRQEQVTLLRSIGFGNSEIALLLGVTKNSVAIAVHRQSRKSKGK